jgi:hypothetical protein
MFQLIHKHACDKNPMLKRASVLLKKHTELKVWRESHRQSILLYP